MKFSLRKKMILFILIMALIISAMSVLISRGIINKMVNDQYTARATEIADTVAVSLDPEKVDVIRSSVLDIYFSLDESERFNSEFWGEPEFDEYLSHFDAVTELPEFQDVMEQLRSIQDQNEVDCLYLYYPDKVSEAFIYLIDAAEEDACSPGCFDQYDMELEVNRNALDHPEEGMPAYITNTEAYGYLVSVGVPIFYGSQVIAFSCVDIEMDTIRTTQRSYLLLMAGVLLLIAVVVCIIGFVIVERGVVRPINMLSETAANYIKEENSSGEHHGFADLNIRSGDEIGMLAESMKKMENDINDYYSNLLSAKQEIIATREEAIRLSEAANRDALTGIRNKRAYDQMMEELDAEIDSGEAKFGIAMVDLNYLKTINDQYGHDKGNIAIRKLCRLICVTFCHSPVFRIGGDEFAIILKNSDLEHIEELVGKFESELAENDRSTWLDPWEKTSAALGYTFYRKGEDRNAEDVFKRADSLMYDHKREMKKK